MKILPSTILISIAVFLLSSTAMADFYKYKDENGVIHLTNDISTIPDKFRAEAKIIKDETSGYTKKVDSLDQEKIIKEAKKVITVARGEAEKFWWRWIVDPETGATKAPAIIAGYLVAAIGTMVFIRRHLSGKLYKVAMKAVLFGFAAIIILTYSAHRGHNAYKKFKASPLNEMAKEILQKRK